VSATGTSDDLVRRVVEDLRARYELDEEDVRELGAVLPASPKRAAPRTSPLPSASAPSTARRSTASPSNRCRASAMGPSLEDFIDVAAYLLAPIAPPSRRSHGCRSPKPGMSCALSPETTANVRK
jgi:hypothetical protein